MTENKAANPMRLGRFLKEYKGSAAGIGRIIFVALVCVAIAGLFFVGALSEARSNEWGGVVALSIIGLIFLLPVLVASAPFLEINRSTSNTWHVVGRSLPALPSS